jgi:hypothetical protein
MIEQELARLSAAIEALNATLAQGHAAVDAREPTPEKPKPAQRAAKKETTTPTTTTEEAPASGDQETETSPVEIDYEKDVKPLILKVGGTKGRDAAVALLGEFDVKAGTALTADQYPAVIARANELLA